MLTPTDKLAARLAGTGRQPVVGVQCDLKAAGRPAGRTEKTDSKADARTGQPGGHRSGTGRPTAGRSGRLRRIPYPEPGQAECGMPANGATNGATGRLAHSFRTRPLAITAGHPPRGERARALLMIPSHNFLSDISLARGCEVGGCPPSAP